MPEEDSVERLSISKKKKEKKVCSNFFDGHYFIPSQFSAYLSKDANVSDQRTDWMHAQTL